jgi:hypothetical protein
MKLIYILPIIQCANLTNVGYSKLIQFLAQKLPQSCLKLNHAVKSITCLDGVGRLIENMDTLTSINSINEKSQYDLLIECYNGVVFKAKHVIVTCSLNYLKKNYMTLFDPFLLNEKKIDAINSVKMDTVDKIFLFYDDMSFFPESINSIHPLYLNEAENNSSVDLIKNWHLKTFAFDRFYDNMLLVWITGQEANHIENLNDEEISKTLTDLLKRLLNKNDIPAPAKIIKLDLSV